MTNQDKSNKRSHDPRVNRLDLNNQIPDQPVEHWESYEVFHQEKRGKQHVHVGAVRAADPDMAMVFAKEQYARRKTCTNLWVVPTSAIYVLPTEDEDIFETVPEKQHREAAMYKVREKIDAYKAKQNQPQD